MSEPAAAILPGAEPFSAPGGPAGVLVVHGFTGTPHSLRPVAEALAGAGFSVELPLLPGHGTRIEDMQSCTWDDWSGAVEVAYGELASRSDSVAVVGLSMGGTLSCWLAAHHAEIAGVVAINPLAEPPAESFLELLGNVLAAGEPTMPGIGSDIAQPGVTELAYTDTPIAPLRSVMEAVTELAPRLGEIRCPVLLFNSPQDHVVPPSSGDYLAERVSGPVERVSCERSYHVATLDYDGPEIAARTVEFCRKVTAGAPDT
jgi:carboxylesterase